MTKTWLFILVFFVICFSIFVIDTKVTGQANTRYSHNLVQVLFIDEDGDLYGVKQADNKMRVSAMPYLYDLAEGNIANHSVLDKFGRDPTIATTDEEMWDQSQSYTYLTSAATLYASSSEGADDQEITVFGLDANYDNQTATVTLTGQSQAEIIGVTWIRVFRAYNSDSSDTTGDVYIAETDDLTGGVPDAAAKIKIKILKENQQTLMSIWTVPAGKTAFIVAWYGSTNAKKITTFKFKSRENGKVFRTQRTKDIQEGSYTQKFVMPLSFPEKTDLVITSMTVAGGGAGSSGFSLWYE